MSEMGIRKEDFAFTIEVAGEKWDCYYFRKDGKDGTMGFTERDGQFIIGMFTVGRLTRPEARRLLEKSHKREVS